MTSLCICPSSPSISILTPLLVCLRLPDVRYSTGLPGISALCPVLYWLPFPQPISCRLASLVWAPYYLPEICSLFPLICLILSLVIRLISDNHCLEFTM